VAGEFIHAKMFARLNETIQVDGTRVGLPVSGRERLGDTFQNLSFSHGHNMLLVSGQHRWFPGGDRGVGAGRIQPRVGLGVGAALPHVEVITASTTTDEYQSAGFAAQILGGADIDLSKHLALLVEYKLTYADIKADLSGGGRLEVAPLAHHLAIGLSVVFGRANPAVAVP
jgi:lipid A oxidase